MTSGAQPINSGAPVPVQGVTGGPGINQGTASVEPGTGALVFHPNPANVVQVRGSTPGAFQVYEYFHTNTDFARVSLNAKANGPFQLAVETAPTSVIRDLEITATGNLIFAAGANPSWTIDGVTQSLWGDGTNSLGIGVSDAQWSFNCAPIVIVGGMRGGATPPNGLGIGSGSFTTATAGGASALPATPAGYLQWAIGNNYIKVPYYAD